MAQLAIAVLAPAVQMAVLCEREDVVSTARDGCENALALADLSALEEIDATEVVERLVHNVLVAQHAGRAVTAGVQTTRGIQSDGDVLRVTFERQRYSSAAKIDDGISRHLGQEGGLRNHSRLKTRAQLPVRPALHPYAIRFVVAPAIHHGLGRFSLGEGRHVISAVLAEPVSFGDLHHLFELPIRDLAAALATRLLVNRSEARDLPCSRCDMRDRIRRREQAGLHR